MDTKTYFDNESETWDERFYTPKLTQFLEKLVPQLGLIPGQKILDVGTGTGVLIPYLTEAVRPHGSVTAIDLSEKMIQKCNEKHSHISNFDAKVGNIEKEIFPPESFDAVICFGMFPHVEQKQKALQNINSILKTKGKFVIAHALGNEELKAHHRKVSKHVAHSMLPQSTQMIHLLEQTGFTKISIKDEPGCYLCTAYKI